MAVTIKGATTIKGLTSVNWSPNLLFAAGEQGVWYDPSDFSTMFQDTAGTTPVTATGQSVARINDKSGNGNNATQSTAANRPTLQIDGNGKYYLSFDGSNDFLQVASFTLPLIQRMTLVGFQENAAVANQGCVSVYPATGDDYGSQTGYAFNPGNRTTGRFEAIGTDNISYRMQWATSVASIIPASVITEDKQTSAGYLRVNGTQVATVTGFKQFSANSNGGLLLGARWLSSAVAAPYLNGRIYGVIVRGAATSAQQITNAETYMNTRTGAY